jgi:hypothetical protein
MRWLALACFSWILWMDQTVYTLPDNRHQPQEPVAAEGAKSQIGQLAVLPTKAACDALRMAQAQQAQAQQAAQAQQSAQPEQRPVYPDHHRFFCTPTDDEPGTGR